MSSTQKTNSAEALYKLKEREALKDKLITLLLSEYIEENEGETDPEEFVENRLDDLLHSSLVHDFFKLVEDDFYKTFGDSYELVFEQVMKHWIFRHFNPDTGEAYQRFFNQMRDYYYDHPITK